jgi:alkylhydroperoxidase family enzyme
VDAVLDDYTTAPIDARERALFAFIDKMNADSTRIGRADVDALKAEGWTEEAIYDAITVCALFKFYNAWIDATGVHDMPAAAYEMSGKRLATQGYRPQPAGV